MTEGRTAAELEALIERCMSGYPEIQAKTVMVHWLPEGHIPNWDYTVQLDGPEISGSGDVLVREIAGLKQRFHLTPDK